MRAVHGNHSANKTEPQGDLVVLEGDFSLPHYVADLVGAHGATTQALRGLSVHPFGRFTVR